MAYAVTMPDDEGDTSDQIVLEGRTYRRVRFGGERHREDSPCPGCGTYYGDLHQPGCECEECPACGGVAGDCGCR